MGGEFTWYDILSQVGFPILFIWGLRNRWWVMASEIKVVEDRMGDLVQQLRLQREQLDRAATIAEQHQEQIMQLRVEIARMATRLEEKEPAWRSDFRDHGTS